MADHGFGGWDTAPGCIQHGISGAPYPNVYKPYEKCADYFTFGRGSDINTLAAHVNSTYWVVVAVGFIVMVVALIGWVVLEHKKLQAQAAYLREAAGMQSGGQG